MIVVMNVVTVDPEKVATFEERFLTRERLLNEADGFAGFELLKREIDDGAEFSVMSQAAFQGWVQSDLFNYEVLDAEVPA